MRANLPRASMATYPSLRGKSVLITGGSAGIGAATVAALGLQGARISFVDIDETAARNITRVVEEAYGVRPLYRICDLRDIAATLEAVDQLSGEGGPFTALINNAGDDEAHSLESVTVDYWDDRVAVNLRHQFFLAQALAPQMATAGGGAIVNMGSVAWMIGASGVPVYATLKSAVSGLTKTLARELGPQRIRVNAIAPGWVLTERQLQKGRKAPGKFEEYLARQCLKEHVQPEDVAQMALWLIADESARCTGQIFTVDAGVS